MFFLPWILSVTRSVCVEPGQEFGGHIWPAVVLPLRGNHKVAERQVPVFCMLTGDCQVHQQPLRYFLIGFARLLILQKAERLGRRFRVGLRQSIKSMGV